MVELKIDEEGNKWWYQFGRYHRLNSPAVIHITGDKWWYQFGKLHRLDGQAKQFSNLHYSSNIPYWYYQGVRIECSTQKEFDRLIKLRLLW